MTTTKDSPPAETDRELLRAFATQRDERAFNELVHRHATMVYGVCRRMTGHPDDADDATQAVFVVLARKAGSLWQANQVAAWLHGVARRIALESKRSRIRRQRAERNAMIQTTREGVSRERPDEVDALTRLDDALGRLPASLRQALVLRYFEGLSQKQAAEIAGCPTGTMAWRTNRGLERLRRRFGIVGSTNDAAELETFLEHASTTPMPSEVADRLLHWHATRVSPGSEVDKLVRAYRIQRGRRIGLPVAILVVATLVLWLIMRSTVVPDEVDRERPLGFPCDDYSTHLTMAMPGPPPSEAVRVVRESLRDRADHLRVPPLTVVHSAADGTVQYADHWPDTGEVLVIIEHETESSKRGPFCSIAFFRGSPHPLIQVGAHVERGQVLGRTAKDDAAGEFWFGIHDGRYFQVTPSLEARWKTEALALAGAAGWPIEEAAEITWRHTEESAIEFRWRDRTIVDVALLSSICETDPRPQPVALWLLDRGPDEQWRRPLAWLRKP
ncbi:MAG: sigma-70 family RNA polymerase sigma factor [Planctomycetes bacterium]|nr:sigma-70 family RNA polymerase sigma factor [Planctomycetota bacterium]